MASGALRVIARLAKAVMWTGAALVVAAVLYVAAAWGLGRLAVNGDFAVPPPGQGVAVSLSSNGAHTNLHLPVVTPEIDWRRVFPPGNAPYPPVLAATVSIGWGNRDFYLTTPTWADFRFSTGLRAVLGLGPSALHVSYLPPGWRGTDQRTFTIPADAYASIVADILDAAGVDPAAAESARHIPGYSYGGNDAFYEAAGRYSPILTCNEWVRRLLADAGIRTARWAVMPDPLLRHAADLAPGGPGVVSP